MGAFSNDVAVPNVVGDTKIPKLFVHCLLLLIPVAVAYLYFDGQLFGYHATFMSLGFMLCMAEGVWLASKAVVLPPGEERLGLLKMHMYIQLAGIFCIAVGFYAIYHNKDVHGKAHFQTYHSWSGLLVLAGTLVSPVLGALGFRHLGLIHVFPEHLHGVVKLVHRKSGAFTYFGSVFAVMLGLATPVIHKGLITYVLMLLVSVAGGLIFNIYLVKQEEGYSLLNSVRAP
mmetsp:Transcript_4076/g.7892  ORF Transcript_4076/g.7892 Transcript_4076/m.7892 type:complete len:229 (+) Transcript_4076:146-832(+)|eukprot:CAMPEP_0114237788 /NCGR_PEP_ID=MMETSP0058-20121206/7577_1 /TAXON_ID=36894 /ORGANISM="Pyramimonas parkeae, CCMP726" /LENGTH=228 /DNA_ID=CAMNT_0001349853 /DNA_START=140 /DNA_END=826 /DNA_ORIENTATION=+